MDISDFGDLGAVFLSVSDRSSQSPVPRMPLMRVPEIEEILEEVPAQQNLEENRILEERNSKVKRFFSCLPKMAKITKRKLKAKINKYFSCISCLWEESDDVKWLGLLLRLKQKNWLNVKGAGLFQ